MHKNIHDPSFFTAAPAAPEPVKSPLSFFEQMLEEYGNAVFVRHPGGMGKSVFMPDGPRGPNKSITASGARLMQEATERLLRGGGDRAAYERSAIKKMNERMDAIVEDQMRAAGIFMPKPRVVLGRGEVITGMWVDELDDATHEEVLGGREPVKAEAVPTDPKLVPEALRDKNDKPSGEDCMAAVRDFCKSFR